MVGNPLNTDHTDERASWRAGAVPRGRGWCRAVTWCASATGCELPARLAGPEPDLPNLTLVTTNGDKE
jgi:hypothetical protein